MYFLLVPYRFGGGDTARLPGWEERAEEGGEQGNADDEAQFLPGNGEGQARRVLLEEIGGKDVVGENQPEDDAQYTAYGSHKERFEQE